jgi:hypothetical protein
MKIKDFTKLIKKYAKGKFFWFNIILMIVLDGLVLFFGLIFIPKPYNLLIFFLLPISEGIRMKYSHNLYKFLDKLKK